jgi:hypothetical protein
MQLVSLETELECLVLVFVKVIGSQPLWTVLPLMALGWLL